MKKTLFIVLGVFLLTSCFHKSVMKDEADDIIKSQIYNFKDGKYLVTLESIFQATSKSREGEYRQYRDIMKCASLFMISIPENNCQERNR